MLVCAIISKVEKPELALAIKSQFENNFIEFGENQWFVASELTIAKEVADKLEITSGKFGNVVVVALSGYYGWANNSIWEWLALKRSAVSAPQDG